MLMKIYCRKRMENLKKKYIVDNDNRKVAVQLDINTFRKIEDILENYALYRLMNEDEGSETLNLEQAKSYYSKLDKAD